VRTVGQIIGAALEPGADLEVLAARAAALCERRPLYPGQNAFPTFGRETA
jgi:hypothetical protein